MSKQPWTLSNMPNLTGKIIIVTGGNSGLGASSVKAFAEKGATVILASRSLEKGQKAKADIGLVSGSIEVMQLDLQDFSSIEKFAAQFKSEYSQLDVLLNNAGIMMTPYSKTKDGLEAQIGTNHFGHFKLTGLLLDTLKNTPQSRVVNVSSIAHKRGRMHFDNLMFDNGSGYNPTKAYGQSKLANLHFTFELQRFFEANNINSIAVAAHPGVAMTNLANHLQNKLMFKILMPLAKGLFQSAEGGALPQIRASVDANVKGAEYYGPDGFQEIKGNPVVVKALPHALVEADAKKLWQLSEEITKTSFQ